MYMEETINNVINNFLINEGFFDKQKKRLKNGIDGFDTGANYQQGIDLYSSNSSATLKKFEAKVGMFKRYVKYFYSYQGSNKAMLALIDSVRKADYYASFIYGVVKEKVRRLNEGIKSISNRVRGFWNGYMNQDKPYGRNEEQNKLDDDYYHQIKDNLNNLSQELNAIKKYNRNFWNNYGHNEKCIPLLKNLNAFCQILGDLVAFINDVILYEIESSVKERVRDLRDEMMADYDDESNTNNVDNNETFLDKLVKKGVSKFRSTKLGGKIGDYLDKQEDI